MIVTDYEKNHCSGCGLCVSICPVNAIKLECDEYGYMYPSISDSCIKCGKCYNLCPYNSDDKLEYPLKTYAAVRKNKDKLEKSSSGGVFAAIAEKSIKKGWKVAGCIIDDSFHVVQEITDDMQKLYKMYGSKYVQSSMENLYEEVNKCLVNGNKVLFSGTPCQVSAIKKYCKNDRNLYTVELICHGVPNEKMFLSYVKGIGVNIEEISNFIFRDKKQGWSFNNKIELSNGKKITINHRLSSYMTYFLDGETYRDCCYNCKYACKKRGADITIGDFWGVVRKRPDLKKVIDINNGVSCLLVNSLKGESLLENVDIELYNVDYQDIREGNEPLNHPSVHTEKRKKILNVWKKNLEWKDVDKYWEKNDYKFTFKLWSFVPIKIQHFIRILLGMR